MLIDEVKLMVDPFDRFLYYIAERWLIRQKRLRGDPPPWTIDSILATYRFCNIRRADDRVTTWLVDHWYRSNAAHPNLLLACALARFINQPSTLAVIGFPYEWQPERIKELARDVAKCGPIFNVAYSVYGGNKLDSDKLSTILDQFLTPLAKNPPIVDCTSMKRSYNALAGYYGFGSHPSSNFSFMAGQVIADLRLSTSPSDSIYTWKDKMLWSPMSSAAQSAMDRLYGAEPTLPNHSAKVFRSRYTDDVLVFGERLQELIGKIKLKLPLVVTEKMEAVDYEHCLAMWDRYERALSGETVKHKYVYPTQMGGSRFARRRKSP